jgi:hypothetical protein
VAQKDSKKSVAKKLKSTKKSVAKKADSKKKKKKKSKSELKKLVAKAEKRAAKKPAVKKSSTGKNGAETRQATPVRTRRAPATASEVPSSTWNVIALRAHARAAGVVGYSRMKKDDLLAHLAVH